MPRPVRVEYAGACYHVINRGNRREQVYFSDYDYRLFLVKLEEYVLLYDVIVYSYCLMPNHYHIFLKTTHANLGRFMQSFNTSFTLTMNHKYNKWSSYRYYLGVSRKPKWINTSFVLSSWGHKMEDKILNYRTYTDEGLLLDNYEELSPDERRHIEPLFCIFKKGRRYE